MTQDSMFKPQLRFLNTESLVMTFLKGLRESECVGGGGGGESRFVLILRLFVLGLEALIFAENSHIVLCAIKRSPCLSLR